MELSEFTERALNSARDILQKPDLTVTDIRSWGAKRFQDLQEEIMNPQNEPNHDLFLKAEMQILSGLMKFITKQDKSREAARKTIMDNSVQN